MSRRGGARTARSAATLPPSRPFVPHMRRFEPNSQFSRLWYREFAELLNPRHPSEVKLEELNQTELGLSEERRAQIEKMGKGPKANYFVKDASSGEKYFVKQSLNLERLKREWLASQKFLEHRIPSVLTAVHWFECQDEKSVTQNSGFIVFPFLSCRTLKEIYSCDIRSGLVSMTEVFALTDPDSEESSLYLHHGDLHAQQIVFDHEQCRWFLVDFGNAKLSFEESIGSAPPRWVDLDVIPGSNYTLPAEVEFARLRILFKPGLRSIWRRVEEACKANSRLLVLSALQSLYEDLYGPLPRSQRTEVEQLEFSVLNGVNRVTLTGVSYVEAAQLERKRAEERAKRNNKGFMQQVQMLVTGASVMGSSPRRAIATATALRSPKIPGKGSPKKSRPSTSFIGILFDRQIAGAKRNLTTALNEAILPPATVVAMRKASAEEQDEPVMIDSPPSTPHGKPAPRRQSPALLSDEDMSTITLDKSKASAAGLAAVVKLVSPTAAAKGPLSGGAFDPVIVSDSSPSSPSSSIEPPSSLPPIALQPEMLAPQTVAVAVAHAITAPTLAPELELEPEAESEATPKPMLVKEEEPVSSKLARALSLRDPSPEIAAIEISVDSASASHSSESCEPSPPRTAPVDVPPESPSTSASAVAMPSPKRSKVQSKSQRLEEEARAWANRQERRSAAAAATAPTSMSPPRSRASPAKSTSSPKRAPDVDRRVAEEALAWQRRLDRRTAEQKS